MFGALLIHLPSMKEKLRPTFFLYIPIQKLNPKGKKNPILVSRALQPRFPCLLMGSAEFSSTCGSWRECQLWITPSLDTNSQRGTKRCGKKEIAREMNVKADGGTTGREGSDFFP